ncbi:TIGR02269 family lipoprotein [Myxococcaceae bacterium GXIMD 01537]
MARVSRLVLLLLGPLVVSCAASDASLREEATSSWQEACEDPRSLVTHCDDEGCALFRCRDVAPGPVLLAYRGVAVAPPPLAAPGPGAARYWGSAQRIPQDAQPVFVIPWYNAPSQRLLPSRCAQQRLEAEELARRPRVKHHIFPQQPILKDWFESKGINVHEWTLVLFKDDHDRIHRGPEGGPWNEAWRQYMRANRAAPKEALWRHAGELIQRFELFGPVIPYHRRDLPPLCVPRP